MGYWAKDGSYQYDENDLRNKERINETQGQAYERHEKGLAAMKVYEEAEKRKKQAQREYEAQVIEENREEEKKIAQKRQSHFSEAQKRLMSQKNIQQYGVDINFRNPQSLEERRSRANYWRIENPFHILLNYVNGKSKKMNDLWTKYSQVKTEEERLQIVEQMEKMFPTKESDIRRVEKKAGYHK